MTKIEKRPAVGDKSHADKIGWSMAFIPGEDQNGISYEENVRWLDQFYSATARSILTNRRILLVVGSESNPSQVWSMRNNKYNGTCHLEWIDDE